MRKYSSYLSIALVLCFALLAGLNRTVKPLLKKYSISSPKGYMKSFHARQKIKSRYGKYFYSYRFRDHQNRLKTWKWSLNKRYTDKKIKHYGVPEYIYQSYQVIPSFILKSQAFIARYMFRLKGKYLIPDINGIIKKFFQTTTPLYLLMEKSFEGKKPGRQERIELLLKFVQDIAYGVPPKIFYGKYINELFPPPLLLNRGWGDCDSKAVLFSSILLHYSDYKIIFIHVPNHLFLGINGIPKPYQRYVRYRGERYIFCEPTGPARYPFGTTGTPYGGSIIIEPIDADKPNFNPRSRMFGAVDIDEEGYSFSMRILEKSKAIKDKSFVMRVNTRDRYSKYYAIKDMPDSDGYYHFGAEYNKINVWLKKPGYHIFTSLKLKGKRKELKVDFKMDRGKCFYIKTKPNASVFVYRLSRKKRKRIYSGYECQADEKGIIRLIIEPGLYDVARSGKTLSKRLVRFDYFRGIPAYAVRR